MASAVYSADAFREGVPAPVGGLARVFPSLADSLNADQGIWLREGLGVCAFLVVIAVGLQKLFGRKGGSTEISGQPIGVSAQHPPVEKPDFDSHKEQVWNAITGLRSDYATIKGDIHALRALRDENGKKLTEVATKLDHTNDAVNTLSGEVRQFMKEHSRK